MTEVRLFARRDREQLVRLASAHAAAAIPGASIPSSVLLDQLERPVGEPIIGSWVQEQATLVAIEADQVVAATHLRRYVDDDLASSAYRNAGEVVWLLCWPQQLGPAAALLDAALGRLRQWGTDRWYADGTLPAPGVYGVSDAWPHISRLYAEAGFEARLDRTSPGVCAQRETVFAGCLSDVPPPGPPPLARLVLRRQLGSLGTAFNAVRDADIVGAFEFDDDLTRGGTNLAFAGWVDECNHWVHEDFRRRGIGTWLVAHAADWLRLGGKTRLMTYTSEAGGTDQLSSYYARFGLQPVNRTTRGWARDPTP